MKRIKKIHHYSEVLSVLVILLTFVCAPYFYAHFPSVVPTHFDLYGKANGYSNSFFAAFLFPVIILFIYGLITYLPKIDPKKENYEEFEGVYAIIKTTIVIFMALIYFISSFKGLGYNIRIDIVIPLFVGIIIIIIGACLPRIKSNWFIGVRTPWTLSSEEVWKKTHVFSGSVFVFGGLIMFIASFLYGPLKALLFVVSIILIAVVPIVYSYLVHRKIHRK